MPRIERPEPGSEEAKWLRRAMEANVDSPPRGWILQLFDALQAERARKPALGMGRGLQWQNSRHLTLGESVIVLDRDWFGWEWLRMEAWGRSSAFAIWPEAMGRGTERAWSLYAVRNGGLAQGIFASRWEAMQAAQRWDNEDPPMWRAPDFFPKPVRYFRHGGRWEALEPRKAQWPADCPVPRREIPRRAA